jgi:hypothetical protein
MTKFRCQETGPPYRYPGMNLPHLKILNYKWHVIPEVTDNGNHEL